MRRSAEAACLAYAAGLPPARPSPAAPRIAEDLLAHAFQVNATDAALDAAGAGGSAGRTVDDLREGLRAFRDGLVGVRYALIADDLAIIPVRADAARRGLAAADDAAARLGVAACRAERLGGARAEALLAAADALRRAQQPTGDYAVDLRRACRLLPAPPGVVPRPQRGPAAQTRALALRQALKGFEEELAGLAPPPARAALHRSLLRDVRAGEQFLFDYVNAVGVSDPGGAARAAAGVRRILVGVRARADAAGLACP